MIWGPRRKFLAVTSFGVGGLVVGLLLAIVCNAGRDQSQVPLLLLIAFCLIEVILMLLIDRLNSEDACRRSLSHNPYSPKAIKLPAKWLEQGMQAEDPIGKVMDEIEEKRCH